jgi:trafficking protein particle complex subunit 11
MSESQSEVPSMDSYMVSLKEAISRYESGENVRSAQSAKLQLAQEFIKQEAWDEALHILRPLWHSMSWRREGWWDLLEEVGTILRKVAAKTGDGGTIVAVDWELMSASKWIIWLPVSRPDTDS